MKGNKFLSLTGKFRFQFLDAFLKKNLNLLMFGGGLIYNRGENIWNLRQTSGAGLGKNSQTHITHLFP